MVGKFRVRPYSPLGLAVRIIRLGPGQGLGGRSVWPWVWPRLRLGLQFYVNLWLELRVNTQNVNPDPWP